MATEPCPSDYLNTSQSPAMSVAGSLGGNQEPGRELCSVCRDVILWSKTHAQEPSEQQILDYQPSYQALQESASTCPLCYFVLHTALCESETNRNHDDREILKYQVIIAKEQGIGEGLYSIRWRGTPTYPSPYVGDTRGYYFAHATSAVDSNEKSAWRLGETDIGPRLRSVTNWIRECQDHHTACAEGIAGLPKRLLVLEGHRGSERVRLVETSTLVKSGVRYATLSHCWGPQGSQPPLTSTSDNLQAHYRGIPLDQLTLNFQHAVLVCAQLDIEYIWIDSLCIIQDSKSDWEDEAAKMANIYRGGYVNIAATASANAHGGFLGRESLEPPQARFTDIHYSIPGPAEDGPLSNESISIQPDLGYIESLRLSDQTYPYFSRGWILQELVLAPRTVLFPQGQFFWQCRQRFASEDGSLSSNDFVTLANGTPGSSFMFEIRPDEQSRTFWYHLVSSYIQRELTYASDVAPAIAGLVDFFLHRTGYTPVLGLWKQTLAFDLGWRLDYWGGGAPSVESMEESGFPSWSWLSPFSVSRSKVALIQRAANVPEGLAPILEVEHWAEEWAGPAYTSKLLSSQLIVSSPSQDAVVEVGRHRAPVMLQVKIPSWRGAKCHWFVDRTYPEIGKVKVKLLQLYQRVQRRQGGGNGTVDDEFLVLQEKSDRPGCFFRIGYGDASSRVDDCFSDGKSHEVHFKRADRETIELI